MIGKGNIGRAGVKLLACFMLAALCSCVDDSRHMDAGGAVRNGKVFEIPYTFNDGIEAAAQQNPVTRAVAATVPEKEIKDVAILFFKDEDDTYVACDSYNSSRSSGSSGSISFQIPNGVVPNKKYKLLIIGNYNSYKPQGKTIVQFMADHASTATTYSEMKELLYTELADNSRRVVTPLPYMGVLVDGNRDETVLTAPDNTVRSLSVSIRFSRIVSRFDLKNMAADKLNIQWAKVCNYRQGGYAYLANVPMGEIIRGTSSSAPSMGSLPQGYVAAQTKNGNRQSLEGGLYAFPNVVNVASQDDRETTFVLIAGYYTKPGDPENTTNISYYRLNVAKNGKMQLLRQNNIYTLVINNVKKAGASTEEGAANSVELLLDYEVDDFWENDATNNAAVDLKGNYITLSNTTLVLGPEAGESAIVKVGLKEGLQWDTYWKENPGDDTFKYERIDNSSFRITTLKENNQQRLNNGKLIVKATGGTIAADSPLELEVNVVQMTKNDSKEILFVDGKQTDFDYKVPGEGARISLPVLTGGQDSKWKIEVNNELSSMLQKSYNTEGADKGVIDLRFVPNTTSSDRAGIMTVYRLKSDGNNDPNIKPIKVTFTQPKSSYIVRLNCASNPNIPLTVDCYVVEKGIPNGIAKIFPIYIDIVDKEKYNIKVESTFNMNLDLCLLKSSNKKLKCSFTGGDRGDLTNKLDMDANEQVFYAHVFRGGPGDEDIKGNITVTATPKEEYTNQLVAATYSLPITITSSCINSEIVIQYEGAWYQIMDRNYGAPAKNLYPKPKNYSCYSTHPDNENRNFLGEALSYSEDDYRYYAHLCNEWAKDNGYLETNEESWMNNFYIRSNWMDILRFAKGRIYVYQETVSGKHLGTYMPYTVMDSWDNCFYAMDGRGYDRIRVKAYAAFDRITSQSDPTYLRCYRKLSGKPDDFKQQSEIVGRG